MILINDGLYAFYDKQLESNSYNLINQLGENVFINPTLNSIIEFFEKFDIETQLKINVIYTENNPIDFIEFISFLKNHNTKCNFKILPNFEYDYLDFQNDEYIFEIIDSKKIEIGLFKFNVIKTNGISQHAVVLTYKEYAFTGLSLSSNHQYDEIYDEKQFQESLNLLENKINETMFICPTYGEPTRLKIINHKKKYN